MDEKIKYDLSLIYAKVYLKRHINNGDIDDESNKFNVPTHVAELECLVDGFKLAYDYLDNVENLNYSNRD